MALRHQAEAQSAKADFVPFQRRVSNPSNFHPAEFQPADKNLGMTPLRFCGHLTDRT
jgi:hypothetical protein